MGKVNLESSPEKHIEHVVTVQRGEQATTMYGAPSALACIVQYFGNVVWPGWQLHPDGRKYYAEKYIDLCVDGSLTVDNKHFFEMGWPRVKKHLQVDGIIVHETKT